MKSRREFLTRSFAGVSGLYLLPFDASAGTITVPRSASDDPSWDEIRKQFLRKPGIVFMNNASLGLPPQTVVNAVTQGYELISRSPVEGKLLLQKKINEEVLPALAKSLTCKPEELVLTRNASEAIQLSVMGLKLLLGDEAIITTQEHPSGKRPWKFREVHQGLVLKEVFIPSPISTISETIHALEGAVTSRTRAIAFCHITRGGHLYPVKEITDWATSKNLVTLVDGAQAAGMLSLSLPSLGCDTYAASLHKWMLAPLGTGFLYVKTGSRNHFSSLYDPDSTVLKPNYDPTGTMDLPLKAAIGAALDFHNRLGSEMITQRLRYLSDYLKEKLATIKGCRMLSGARDTSAPGSTIFELEGINPVLALTTLEANGIFIDEHVRDGHKAFRVSTHYYNSLSEIDQVVGALKALNR